MPTNPTDPTDAERAAAQAYLEEIGRGRPARAPLDVEVRIDGGAPAEVARDYRFPERSGLGLVDVVIGKVPPRR